MECVVAAKLLLAKKNRYLNAAERRKRLRARWQRAFARRQSQERMVFVVLLSMSAILLQSPVRSVWVKERSVYWWEQVVNSTFTQTDWFENFRMSQATFNYICNELRQSIQRRDTQLRKAIPVEQRVAVTLWFLATNADYRTIAHLFGVSKSTVCIVTKEVCKAIVTILLPKYIRFPSGDELKAVVEGFEHKWEFPQCVGAVDGSHIPIISPEEYPADYYNRKGWHSILLQGTVNHLGLFTDIYVGWPGRVHDARVFSNSSLFSRGQSGDLLPSWTQTIGGKDVPLVMLGDPAYPLLPWLMKAFPDNGRLTRQQKMFNYRLSRARVVVEHTYGRLKGRWRCLLKRLDVSVCDVPELIAACCVLHNVCEVHGDNFSDEWLEEVSNNCTSSNRDPNSTMSQTAENIRIAFMKHFSTA